jgi:hypothetical protein
VVAVEKAGRALRPSDSCHRGEPHRRPASCRPRTKGHLFWSDLSQREPLLPGNAEGAVGDRATCPRRQPARGRRPRRQDRRAFPLQARAAHQ